MITSKILIFKYINVFFSKRVLLYTEEDIKSLITPLSEVKGVNYWKLPTTRIDYRNEKYKEKKDIKKADFVLYGTEKRSYDYMFHKIEIEKTKENIEKVRQIVPDYKEDEYIYIVYNTLNPKDLPFKNKKIVNEILFPFFIKPVVKMEEFVNSINTKVISFEEADRMALLYNANTNCYFEDRSIKDYYNHIKNYTYFRSDIIDCNNPQYIILCESIASIDIKSCRDEFIYLLFSLHKFPQEVRKCFRYEDIENSKKVLAIIRNDNVLKDIYFDIYSMEHYKNNIDEYIPFCKAENKQKFINLKNKITNEIANFRHIRK